MIKKMYLTLLLLFLAAFAFAQTAAELDDMLAANAVSAQMAARFILGAADLLPPELSGAQAETAAYNLASANGWIKAPSGSALTLTDTAFLIMKAFNLKGGIMYSIFKNPRYAYREMIYLGIIQGTADPKMTVSGERFLQILDKTFIYIEGNS